MQNCVAILQSMGNPRRDFPWRPTPPWRGAIALLTAQVPELCRRAGAGSNGGGRAPRNPASATHNAFKAAEKAFGLESKCRKIFQVNIIIFYLLLFANWNQ